MNTQDRSQNSSVKFLRLGASRRQFLTTASLLSASALTGCGDAIEKFDPDPDIEGIDFFTVGARVFNLAANYGGISLSASGITFATNLPYGAVSPVSSAVLDAPYFRNTGKTGYAVNVTTSAPASSSTINGFTFLQALYLATSNSRGVSLTIIGGVAGAYPAASLGTGPASKIYLITSAIGSVNAFTQATPSSAIQSAGLVTNSTLGVSIPAQASTSFRLTLTDSVTGAAVYNSGLKTKDESTGLFIARDAALSANWTVFAIDKNFAVSVWPNTL
jgi:hypothetical protein